MTDWARQWEIFHAVLERPTEERAAELERLTAGHAELRGRVERLLAHAEPRDDVPERGRELRLSLLEPTRSGERIGPYRLGERLGEGGAGEVYAAERCDGQFAQRVAIKLLKPGFDGTDLVQRFLQERQILARLTHPGIARLLDGGMTGEGQPYIVLELIDGLPIDRYGKRLELGARIELVRRVCAAVDAAHRNLVVHRDLKPGNILVTRDGTPKVLDFGIARPLTEPGGTATIGRMLTPLYASPEQLRGEPVTTATDVYSLGVILYELLSGRSPYRYGSGQPHELARSILEEDPAPPARACAADGKLARRLRGDLDKIVLKALHKDPERRYATPAELAEDLGRHLRAEPVRAQRDTLPYRLGRLAARHPWRLAAAAVFVLLVTAASVTTSVLSFRLQAALEGERHERRAAEAVTEFMLETFETANPAGAAGATGSEVPAWRLLEAGVARIRGDAGMAPALRAELLQVLGRAYSGLHRTPQALELLGDARTIAAGLDDPLRLARIEAQFAATLLDSPHPEEALPMIEHARGHLAASDTDAELATDLLIVHARALTRQGELEGAARDLEEAIERARTHDAGTREAAALVALGHVHRRTGNLAEAEQSLRRAVTLRRTLHGDGHPYTATALETLADVLSDAARYREAEALYLEALASAPAASRAFAPWRANILNDLAVVRQRHGDLAGAERAYRDAMAAKLALYGPEHPELSSTLVNLGWLLHDSGRYEEAEVLYGRALAIDEATYGERHTHLLPKLNNLGLLHLDRGELARAEPLFERGLAISLAELGPEHPVLGLLVVEPRPPRAPARRRGARRGAVSPRARAAPPAPAGRAPRPRAHPHRPGPAADRHRPRRRGRAAAAGSARDPPGEAGCRKLADRPDRVRARRRLCGAGARGRGAHRPGTLCAPHRGAARHERSPRGARARAARRAGLIPLHHPAAPSRHGGECLFDEVYTASGFIERTGHFPGEPRTLVVQVSRSF